MTADDKELVIKIKEDNCDASFTELVSRHEKLFYKICQKYSSVVISNGAYLEDLLSDKEFVFFKSITSYNPDKKTKFSTWLGNYTRFHCLNFINSNCKYVKLENKELEHFIEVRSSKHDVYLEDENKKDLKDKIFHILSKLKDQRIHRVYLERYNAEEKKTWATIAKKLNISTQTVINLHARGGKILRNKMKSQKHLDFV